MSPESQEPLLNPSAKSDGESGNVVSSDGSINAGQMLHRIGPQHDTGTIAKFLIAFISVPDGIIGSLPYQQVGNKGAKLLLLKKILKPLGLTSSEVVGWCCYGVNAPQMMYFMYTGIIGIIEDLRDAFQHQEKLQKSKGVLAVVAPLGVGAVSALVLTSIAPNKLEWYTAYAANTFINYFGACRITRIVFNLSADLSHAFQYVFSSWKKSYKDALSEKRYRLLIQELEALITELRQKNYRPLENKEICSQISERKRMINIGEPCLLGEERDQLILEMEEAKRDEVYLSCCDFLSIFFKDFFGSFINNPRGVGGAQWFLSLINLAGIPAVVLGYIGYVLNSLSENGSFGVVSSVVFLTSVYLTFLDTANGIGRDFYGLFVSSGEEDITWKEIALKFSIKFIPLIVAAVACYISAATADELLVRHRTNHLLMHVFTEIVGPTFNIYAIRKLVDSAYKWLFKKHFMSDGQKSVLEWLEQRFEDLKTLNGKIDAKQYKESMAFIQAVYYVMKNGVKKEKLEEKEGTDDHERTCMSGDSSYRRLFCCFWQKKTQTQGDLTEPLLQGSQANGDEAAESLPSPTLV